MRLVTGTSFIEDYKPRKTDRRPINLIALSLVSLPLSPVQLFTVQLISLVSCIGKIYMYANISLWKYIYIEKFHRRVFTIFGIPDDDARLFLDTVCVSHAN